MKRALRVVAIVAVIVALAYAFRGRLFSLFFRSEPPPEPQRGLVTERLEPGELAVVAEDLEVPWELVFLPDGDILVTERPGRIVRLHGGDRRGVFSVPDVRHIGEGGLMGLALHPEFEEDSLLYVCLTTEGPGGLENRIDRYRLGESGLSGRTPILGGIPGANHHDGCRLEFGPDGLLYVTTGDAGEPARAQDRASLAGKILRVTPDGEVPPGNPSGTPIYSYGHRNPQGLAWDGRGRLWSTEHGRSGFASGFDELNIIEPGKNYGWPAIQGDAEAAGMVRPAVHSGPDYTWAPAGAAHHDGRVFFGGLRGEALYEARLEGADGSPEVRAHFHREFGRIRAVRLGPDGMLYFATSNRDNRGRIRSGDDKIVRVDPVAFQR